MSGKTLRSCFISSPPWFDTAPLRTALEARGVAWSDLSSAPLVGRSVLDMLDHSIRQVDFVCGILAKGDVTGHVLFELGLAIGQDRPVLVFIDPEVEVPAALSSIAYVRASINEAEALRLHLDAFLKHAGNAANGVEPWDDIGQPVPPAVDRAALDRALDHVAAWEASASPPAERELIDFLARTFEATGTVTATSRSVPSIPASPTFAATRADLAVWIDELPLEAGNPFLVDVGGFGSNGAGAGREADRFRQVLIESHHLIGLLVRWENGASRLPGGDMSWPLVVEMGVRELVETLINGTFVQSLREKRNHAVHMISS